MSVREEIAALEERLRLAELGPDPKFFEDVLADDALMDGVRAKAKIVAAHQPGGPTKFTKVEMSDFEIVEHGPTAAVVVCKGTYEGPNWSGSIRFMRTWLKIDGRWQIISAATLK